MKKLNKNFPLTVDVKNDKLIISIGIDTLAYAYEHSDDANPYDPAVDDFVQKYKVKDPLQFAKDVMIKLSDKQEDGTTLMHILFNKICENSCNRGNNGVYDVGEVENEK